MVGNFTTRLLLEENLGWHTFPCYAGIQRGGTLQKKVGTEVGERAVTETAMPGIPTIGATCCISTAIGLQLTTWVSIPVFH